MSVRFEARYAAGSFRLEARFSSDARVTALFGRSGAGKTTIVQLIAGLARPAEGRIVVDDAVLVDTRQGIFLPPHRRRIGYVFQDDRLFPHMSVRQNLAFGRWFAGPAADAVRFDEVVDLLDIAPLLERRPRHLSGGERQRVAIGRALLAAPRLLLMDEPLAALDSPRKAEILPYLDRLAREGRVPIIYVSHAMEEVTRLADALVVVSEGRVVASGPIAEVLARLDLVPLTGRHEAGTLLTGKVIGQDAAYALTFVEVEGQRLTIVGGEDLAVGAPVRLRVRARDVALALAPPAGTSIRNAVHGRIEEIRREEGAFAEAVIALGGQRLRARLTRRSADELGLAAGTAIVALLRAIAVERRQIFAERDEPL